MWVTGGVPVTQLRKMMLEELQRLNYSEETIRSYIHAVEDFSRRFNCSPDRLGPRHVREYQAELTHLKFSDVDSKRMVIHIRGGKGRKDRDVMLSPKLLEELREHWHRLRR